MPKHLGEKAVVIGGSIAGLMTARVLADHFEQVIVLERDQIAEEPAIHKSIPQGNHLHALLLGGEQVLSRLYPGFTDRLQNPTLAIAPGTVVSSAGRRRLGDHLKKVGRFVVKCLADAAIDSAMIRFWP